MGGSPSEYAIGATVKSLCALLHSPDYCNYLCVCHLPGASFEERLRVANQLLDVVPLVDGHNDMPWNIRKFLHNQINDFK